MEVENQGSLDTGGKKHLQMHHKRARASSHAGGIHHGTISPPMTVQQMHDRLRVVDGPAVHREAHPAVVHDVPEAAVGACHFTHVLSPEELERQSVLLIISRSHWQGGFVDAGCLLVIAAFPRVLLDSQLVRA